MSKAKQYPNKGGIGRNDERVFLVRFSYHKSLIGYLRP